MSDPTDVKPGTEELEEDTGPTLRERFEAVAPKAGTPEEEYEPNPYEREWLQLMQRGDYRNAAAIDEIEGYDISRQIYLVGADMVEELGLTDMATQLRELAEKAPLGVVAGVTADAAPPVPADAQSPASEPVSSPEAGAASDYTFNKADTAWLAAIESGYNGRAQALDEAYDISQEAYLEAARRIEEAGGPPESVEGLKRLAEDAKPGVPDPVTPPPPTASGSESGPEPQAAAPKSGGIEITNNSVGADFADWDRFEVIEDDPHLEAQMITAMGEGLTTPERGLVTIDQESGDVFFTRELVDGSDDFVTHRIGPEAWRQMDFLNESHIEMVDHTGVGQAGAGLRAGVEEMMAPGAGVRGFDEGAGVIARVGDAANVQVHGFKGRDGDTELQLMTDAYRERNAGTLRTATRQTPGMTGPVSAPQGVERGIERDTEPTGGGLRLTRDASFEETGGEVDSADIDSADIDSGGADSYDAPEEAPSMGERVADIGGALSGGIAGLSDGAKQLERGARQVERLLGIRGRDGLSGKIRQGRRATRQATRRPGRTVRNLGRLGR